MLFTMKITGTRELIMHNGRLSDPIDPAARSMQEIHGKTKKTIEDHEELARREWAGSLYYREDVGPFIPPMNVQRALMDSGRMDKLGKVIDRAVLVGVSSPEVFPLGYAGPRDLLELLNDENFRLRASVKVGMARVQRTRPIFPIGWTLEVEGRFDEELIDPDAMERIAERAGKLVGLGDWRPRYGRFVVDSFKTTKETLYG